MDLSKQDKKAARLIIEIGLQQEFAQGLVEIDAILQTWKTKPLNNREAYHLVYQKIISFDKHIATTYDHMTGSNYFYIMAMQLSIGVVSLTDLETLSPAVREKLVAYLDLR